jgi:hypothetical protein
VQRALLAAGNSALRVTCGQHGFSHAVASAGFHPSAIDGHHNVSASRFTQPSEHGISAQLRFFSPAPPERSRKVSLDAPIVK